jgi:excisionase family DNA binding protein
MGVIGTVEAARRLNITTGRVRTMIAAGLLPAQKFGRDWAIDESDVDRLAKSDRKAGRPPKKK